MVDFDALLYGPAAAVFGRATDVLLKSGAVHRLTLIDQTEGVEQQAGGIEFATLEPAAEVRIAALEVVGLTRSDLVDAEFDMSSTRWRVLSTVQISTPGGAVAARLLLTEAE